MFEMSERLFEYPQPKETMERFRTVYQESNGDVLKALGAATEKAQSNGSAIPILASFGYDAFMFFANNPWLLQPAWNWIFPPESKALPSPTG